MSQGRFANESRKVCKRVKEGLKNLPHGFPCGRLLAGKLCFFKLDDVQYLLEFLAWDETRQQGIDLCGAHGFGGIGPFGIGLQPEITKIAQFHDVALAQFFRNGGQQGFQHGQRIRAADGGDGADLPGQFAQGQAPAGLDGRVEFLGGFEE